MNNTNLPKNYSHQLKRNIERRASLLQSIIRERSSDAMSAEVKEIVIKDSFDGFLQKFQQRKEFTSLSEREQQKTIDKVFAFLNRAAALENNENPNTINVSDIFYNWGGAQTLINIQKLEIKNFFRFIEENNISLSLITSMQRWKWIPDLKELEVFMDFLEEEGIELSSITSMQRWKWIPDLKELERFLGFLEKNWIDLSSITSMQRWKWIPDLGELTNLIKFLKKNWIDLSSITSMQNWKWIPDLEELANLIKFLKKNWIDLSSIASMQNWKWIPDLEQLEEFINICQARNLNIKSITSKWLWVEESIKLARNI